MVAGRIAQSDRRVTVLIRSKERIMNYLIKLCDRFGILRSDLDYHLVRGSMVLIFALFGYQKWFAYEAKTLIPFISNGPLIFWMYPVFGIRGACWFLGVSEWLFGALILAGYWNKTAGVLGALGGIASFVSAVTIIPFMPDGWNGSMPKHSTRSRGARTTASMMSGYRNITSSTTVTFPRFYRSLLRSRHAPGKYASYPECS
jgi:uncharacterized membrane protein YkgB